MSENIPEATDLAPHTDPAWVDDFVLELRLIGVPGTRIGDALATVDAHLVDTGETAAEAFGPPKDYARELAEAEPERTSMMDGASAADAVFGLIGIVLTPRVVTATLEQRAVTVTVGDLVSLAILAVLTAIVFVAAERVLRWVIDHQVAAVVTIALLTTGFVGVFLAWRTPVVDLPVQAAALAAGFSLMISGLIASRIPRDLLRSPYQATDQTRDGSMGATLNNTGSARRATLGSTLLFPGIAVALGALSWLLWLLS